MRNELLIVADRRMIGHDPGSGHPERPERLEAILDALDREPVPGAVWASPRPAGEELLRAVHDRGYVELILGSRGRSLQLDPDTATSTSSVDAALLAAGAVVDAVRDVVEGRSRRGFALVRPPGHHAEAARAMGFCLFNNVAVAAEYAIRSLGCERVLVVDWDVHHGNGTQRIFEQRPDVLFFSAHQHPLYPGTGALSETGLGAGDGFTVNVPLPPDCSDADYLAVFEELLLPLADAYRPDLVLVSAGFDAHEADPLAGMRLSSGGFAALCEIVTEIADEHAAGRLVLSLEGGYDLEALSESVRAVAFVLGGGQAPRVEASASRGGRLMLDAALARHAKRWPLA
jgi:acetoin utilization deacetylase AcuC-like enzyme